MRPRRSSTNAWALLRELLRFDNAPRGSRSAGPALVETPGPSPRRPALLRRYAELLPASRPAVDQIVAELLELQADRRHEPLAALIAASDAATIGIDEVWFWSLFLTACAVFGGAGAWSLLRRTGGRGSPRVGG